MIRRIQFRKGTKIDLVSALVVLLSHQNTKPNEYFLIKLLLQTLTEKFLLDFCPLLHTFVLTVVQKPRFGEHSCELVYKSFYLPLLRLTLILLDFFLRFLEVVEF